MSQCRTCKGLHWWNLSLVLIPVIIGLTMAFHLTHSLIYMPISMSLSSLILFMNFPKIVLFFHQRPLYYDDLIVHDYSDEDRQIYNDQFRTYYQNIFRWVITFTSALMVGVLTEVWYFKGDYAIDTEGDTSGYVFLEASTAAALVVIYGLMGIYKNLSIYFGKGLMFILKYLKRREIKQRREKSNSIALQDVSELNSPPFLALGAAQGSYTGRDASINGTPDGHMSHMSLAGASPLMDAAVRSRSFSDLATLKVSLAPSSVLEYNFLQGSGDNLFNSRG